MQVVIEIAKHAGHLLFLLQKPNRNQFGLYQFLLFNKTSDEWYRFSGKLLASSWFFCWLWKHNHQMCLVSAIRQFLLCAMNGVPFCPRGICFGRKVIASALSGTYFSVNREPVAFLNTTISYCYWISSWSRSGHKLCQWAAWTGGVVSGRRETAACKQTPSSGGRFWCFTA